MTRYVHPYPPYALPGCQSREVTEMLDLSSNLSDLPAVRGQAPWPAHEYVKGWGVFGLPFDSGHVLALRVFPESCFGPYHTVWHRDRAAAGRSTSTGHDSRRRALGTTAPPATTRDTPTSGTPGRVRRLCG